MPLSGGGAAKVGNRFECRWTVSVLLDVLEGAAESLELEVPGPDAVGTEFRVVVDGVAVWHQVKRQRSGGPWTVASLQAKGGLATWWDKLRRGDRFVFVSGTSAGELQELVERAAAAESWALYREHFLGKDLQEVFGRLRRCWGSPPEEAVYHGLRNVDVLIVDEKRLVAENERRIGALVSGHTAAVAAAVLEQFVNDSVHRSLTTDTTLAMLARHGIEPAPPPGSPALAAPAARKGPSVGPVAWEAGAEVDLGPATYLLQGHLLAEDRTSDGAVVRRARALALSTGAGRDGKYVWIRQVEVRPGSPSGRPTLDALVRERRLLDDLRDVPELPRVVDAIVTGHRATLVVRWPASRDRSRPCDGVDTLLTAPTHDPWRLSRLLSGFADLSRALGRLHGQGVSHRDLSPPGIVLLDDGRLALRDLGLAALPPRAGERLAEYVAPEQRRPGPTPPGPATDVYQLAALLYHLVVGQPPHPASPLPLAGAAPALPPDVARALDAALASEPDERPQIGDLGATLRAGGRALVQRSKHALSAGPATGADDPGPGPRPAGEDAPQGR